MKSEDSAVVRWTNLTMVNLSLYLTMVNLSLYLTRSISPYAVQGQSLFIAEESRAKLTATSQRKDNGQYDGKQKRIFQKS